jgi:UTP--glucose-1-phosphate uridylyltransferase
MQRRIKKAVFPVAGLGTRFLPATKAVPKEMLTIVDKPVIQIVVDEAREAGIEHFVFVTGRNKTAELELLEKSLPRAGETSFTRQQEPLGLGHAVWCARDIVGDEPFALLLPDMLIHARPGCLRQMVDVYEAQGGGNVIAVEEVPWEHVHRYGVVKPGAWSGRAFTIEAMVEKPKREAAPSNLIISGRYILQPEIFAEIEKQEPGAGGEIQITDAMIRLQARQKFSGLKFTGRTYDCGDKIGFLSANVAYGLERGDLSLAFKRELKRIVDEAGGLG